MGVDIENIGKWFYTFYIWFILSKKKRKEQLGYFIIFIYMSFINVNDNMRGYFWRCRVIKRYKEDRVSRTFQFLLTHASFPVG